MCVFCAQMVNL